MKVYVLYRSKGEFSRRVEEYVRDYERTRGASIEAIDIDTREGAELVERYGVMQYPCLMVVRDDGQLLREWQGVDNLPLMNELASYANS
ncbi:MAG: hypothetical protein ABI354_02185 [Candidatus Saccharimonadales bacterium]